MKKRAIGYIFCDNKLKEDEKAFLKQAKKKNVDIIFFNISKEMSEEELEEKAKKCDIIYNNSAEEFAIEIVKTLEELGKKVIDSSKTYYFTEDKWMFFLECKKNKIPVPNTILLSENLNSAKKELLEFDKWPVILKRIEGTQGEYVEKADNINQAVKIIEKFWIKGSERIPIIAQEFIPSSSYRVTTIGNKIVQTAIKENNGWKCTAVYQKKCKRFKVDKKLHDIISRLIKNVKINVCGIDLIKKDGEWIVLEVNSVPALDFFKVEREKLAGEILDHLIKVSDKGKQKTY